MREDGVNDLYKMARDYVSQVYPRGCHPRQRDESEQHFICGVHAGVQLLRQLPPEKLETLDKEIRAFQMERVKTLLKSEPFG